MHGKPKGKRKTNETKILLLLKWSGKENIMSQNLAMPLNTSEITVGYKNYAPGYKINDKPAIHYGVDFKGKTYKKQMISAPAATESLWA